MMSPDEWTVEQWNDVLSRIERRSRTLVGRDCTEWISKRIKVVSPQLQLWDSHQYNVRHLLLAFAGRPPSPGGQIHTSCGNALCVNVMHLFDTQDVPIMRIRKWNELVQQSIVDDKTNCRLWMGLLEKDGYGKTSFMDEVVTVHRFAYEVKVGPIPTGLSVRHDSEGKQKCTSHACFNPQHLSVGTALDQSADELAVGARLRGAAHSNTTLTEEKALAIKHSTSNGSIGKRALQFGVTRDIVARIDAGITWSHLPDRDGNMNRAAADSRNEHLRQNRKRLREEGGGATRSEYEAACGRIERRATTVARIATLASPCQLIPTQPNTNHGYPKATINGVDRSAHIIVAEFHHNDCRLIDTGLHMHVRHLCPGRTCVEPTHLTIGTPRQNTIDTLVTGTTKNTKLTVAVVQDIKQLIELGTSIDDIVKAIPNTNVAIVEHIKYGAAWTWVPVRGLVVY